MPVLDQKVTLITGAKGGLGTFVTEAFLAAGATVVGVSRSIQESDFPNPRFTAIFQWNTLWLTNAHINFFT